MRPTLERTTEAAVDPQFVSRWSPRAFDPEPVTEAELASLFEAARWAPSCFNDQPWLFVYAVAAEEREAVLGAVVESNRTWARHAPVLGVVFARRRFAHNDKPNRWAAFDSGAASLALSLQAQSLGLSTHFMGGFDPSAAHEALDVPVEDYEALAAFAVGRRGEPSTLPEELAEREKPSPRKPLRAVAHRGRFQPE